MEASGKRVSAGINIRDSSWNFDRLPLVSSATATRKLAVCLCCHWFSNSVPAGSGQWLGWISLWWAALFNLKSSFSQTADGEFLVLFLGDFREHNSHWCPGYRRRRLLRRCCSRPPIVCVVGTSLQSLNSNHVPASPSLLPVLARAIAIAIGVVQIFRLDRGVIPRLACQYASGTGEFLDVCRLHCTQGSQSKSRSIKLLSFSCFSSSCGRSLRFVNES